MTNSLHIALKPPAALCAAVSFLHVVAFGCAIISLDGLPLTLVLSGIGLSCYAELRRLRTGASDIDELICRIDGGLELAARSGRRQAALSGNAVLSPWLAIVQISDAAGRRDALVLTPDRVSSDAFRRLRVWLRWHRVIKSESQTELTF